MLAICTTAIAQTSASSTPTSPSRTATAEEAAKTKVALGEVKKEVKALRDELAEREISRLIQEVKTSRDLLAAQRDERSTLEARLAVEQENSASLQRSYDSAQGQINALEDAITSKEKLIALLTEQRDKERRRRKTANQRTAAVAAGAVVGAAAGGPAGAAVGAGVGFALPTLKKLIKVF